MDQSKVWWKSSGVIGGVVASAAGLAGLVGYTVSPDDLAQIVGTVQQTVELVTSIGALAGGAAAIYGRMRATKKIGSGA